MTILAGAFAYHREAVLDLAGLAYWSEFFNGLSNQGQQCQHVSRTNLAFWKWDCGAYGEPAWQQDQNGSFATLCGDPLLTQGGARLDRMTQLSRLHDVAVGFDQQSLIEARGVYSALSYDALTSTLYLATDHVGIRPLYYATQAGVLYVASTLHLLEQLPGLLRTVCSKGLAEHLSFGFSLADRTPYREIALLPEASVLRIDHSGAHASHYFDWNSLKVQDTTPEQAGRELFDLFDEAVTLRLGRSDAAHTFLSGGMDSRSIASSLISHGRSLKAVNFSPDDTQDKAFSFDFADALGDACHLTHHQPRGPMTFSMQARLAFESRSANADDSAAALLAWSGDGGSVCLGYVYLDDGMMELAQAGKWSQACQALLSKNKLASPSRMFSRKMIRTMKESFFNDVMAELTHYDNGDAGRRLYYFLLFNDQRRHLARHFETIHEHRLEFHLPFFDSRFLKAVVRTPARWGIGHRLYGQFFSHFPAVTRSVPWQTYPGHEPCPIRPSTAYRYQWDSRPRKGSKKALAERKVAARSMLGLVRKQPIAVHLSKMDVALSALLHYTGARDYSYLARMAETLSALRVDASPR